jgi:hypothetical protein
LKDSSEYYDPAFFGYEYYNGEKYVDFRLSHGEIISIGGSPYYKETWDNGGRGFIISREDLVKVCNQSMWSDPSVVQGEFNPIVATAQWLKHDPTHNFRLLEIKTQFWPSSVSSTPSTDSACSTLDHGHR